MRAAPRKYGRIYIADQQDCLFQLERPARASKRTFRYWNARGWRGDQGTTSKCVAFAWAHWYEDGPITHRGKPPVADPHAIYALAQDLDEWPGDDYEGTSVRGGAKAMRQLGFISEYRWTKSLDVLIHEVLERGPVVVGTAWWSDMCEPDKSGLIRATGEVLGGHAYVINGVNTKTRLFRIKNSWEPTWGQAGMAYVPFDDMAMLVEDMDGEVCRATEVPDA